MIEGHSRLLSAGAASSRDGGVLRAATLIRAISAFFMVSLVLDGPLRFMLAGAGLAPIIYLPKILLLATLPFLAISGLRIDRGAFAVVSFVLAASVWGFVELGSLPQVLFGLWVMVPLIYGLFIARYMLNDPDSYRRLFAMLFLVAAAGVIFNPIFVYPWVGASLDIGDTSIQMSREWSSSGVDRYSGFSRASFSAASQLLIFAIWLVATGSGKFLKVLVWIIAGFGILLTNSKGPVAAWVIISLFFVSGMVFRHRRSWRLTWTAILYFILLIVVVTPLSTLFFHYNLRVESLGDAFLFASFGDRLVSMWPSSLGLLHNGIEWLLGRGIGGIGSAQMFFETKNYFPGDNVLVYLCVAVGLPAACFFLFSLARTVSKSFNQRESGFLVFALFLFMVIYGLVVNVIEDPLMAFFFGVVVSASNGARVKQLKCV